MRQLQSNKPEMDDGFDRVMQSTELIADRVHFGRPMTWTPENNIGEANVKGNARLEANNISVNRIRFRVEDNATIKISGIERLGEMQTSEEGGSISVTDPPWLPNERFLKNTVSAWKTIVPLARSPNTSAGLGVKLRGVNIHPIHRRVIQ